jgi:endonuclease/exonuclease/phosphatase family metal-dependent hydrolase
VAAWKAALALVTIVVAGCAPARVQSQPAPAPVVLAVVTWNMNAGRGDLPRLVDDLEAGRLTTGTPRDYVLLLQEAVDQDPRRRAALRRSDDLMRRSPLRAAIIHGLSAIYFPVRDDGHRIRGNAILSTRPLADVRNIDLPPQRQRRTAVVATIDVGGRRLFIASAHLENRVSWLKGGLLSDTARGRQAEALLRALPASGPGILGGDLNTWLGPREPAWRTFARRFGDTPTRPSAPTFHDRLVLDHLFFDVPDGWHVSRRVLEEAYGSDHHPVLGVIADQ